MTVAIMTLNSIPRTTFALMTLAKMPLLEEKNLSVNNGSNDYFSNNICPNDISQNPSFGIKESESRP